MGVEHEEPLPDTGRVEEGGGGVQSVQCDGGGEHYGCHTDAV